MVTPNDSTNNEEDDVGALIYREIQLRKTEAAKAAERTKTSTASAHQRRTSTRKRSPVNIQGKESFFRPQRKRSSKREQDDLSLEEDLPRKKAKKQYRKKCSADGCSNYVQSGGVCIRHGAKTKKYRYECSAERCTNKAQEGGVCIRHGAKVKRYECSTDGCRNQAQKGGVCRRHGAKLKRCSNEGCTSQAKNGGVCVRHGATKKQYECSADGCTNHAVKRGVCIGHGAKVKRCSSEGCTKQAQKGGVCFRHGAKVKLCSIEGCTNQAVRVGVCVKHGARRNAPDESTAFGSEFDLTTSTQTRSHHRASRAAIRGQEGRNVPEEVTILCQEIVEV